MTFEKMTEWADKYNLSVRVFYGLVRWGFFETDLSLYAQLNFLQDIQERRVRNLGTKSLKEWQEVVAITLSQEAGYNKIKTLAEYMDEGFTEQEAPLVRRQDVLFNLYKFGQITEDEHEELLQLITALRV